MLPGYLGFTPFKETKIDGKKTVVRKARRRGKLTHDTGKCIDYHTMPTSIRMCTSKSFQISISFNTNTSGTLCSHMFSFPSPRCRENQRKLGTPGGIEQVKEASKMLPSHDHCQNLTFALCTPSGSCCKRLQIEAVVNDVEVNEEFIRLFLDVPFLKGCCARWRSFESGSSINAPYVKGRTTQQFCSRIPFQKVDEVWDQVTVPHKVQKEFQNTRCKGDTAMFLSRRRSCCHTTRIARSTVDSDAKKKP